MVAELPPLMGKATVVGGRDWGMCYLGCGDHSGLVCKEAILSST